MRNGKRKIHKIFKRSSAIYLLLQLFTSWFTIPQTDFQGIFMLRVTRLFTFPIDFVFRFEDSLHIHNSCLYFSGFCLLQETFPSSKKLRKERTKRKANELRIYNWKAEGEKRLQLRKISLSALSRLKKAENYISEFFGESSIAKVPQMRFKVCGIISRLLSCLQLKHWPLILIHTFFWF